MSTVFDFAGQTAIVTGGGSGIGAAIVRLLLEAGATVYAVDRDVSGVHPDALPAAVDVSEWSEMEALVARVLTERGRVDAMINNAGINSYTSILEASVEEFDRIMAVNARGVFIGMKAVLPHMIAAGRGAIVNTGSTAAIMGIDDRASYTASKGAVLALTRQVAVQFARSGVRCNCVHPGSTDSPMVADIVASSPDPEATRQRMERRQPMGRMGRPEEVAAAAVYLASDRASFITGVELTVDGGWTAA